jgi:aminomethyltransferase
VSEGLLRRTALFEAHQALGARIVPFGGFEMPLQYAGIFAEHAAVRHRAGVFDLSHMAQFEVGGPDAAAWLDELTVNHVATMRPFLARYNVFTNDAGGARDDVIIYRLPERWLVVVNAANAAPMWAYLDERRRPGVELANRHGERALIAIQGPRSAAIVAALADGDVAAIGNYRCAEMRVAGVPAILARTGYTGEDGFEAFVDVEEALGVWDAVLTAGRERGAVPCGLGARDVLRLEAGMPLYGHELTAEIGPLQAGIGWCVKFEKPRFPGKAVLAAQAAADDFPRIAGLVLDGRIPARPGYPVKRDGVAAGEVRSGAIAPAVGNKSIATALLDRSSATVGTRVTVEVRGTEHPATVAGLPFYQRQKFYQRQMKCRPDDRP